MLQDVMNILLIGSGGREHALAWQLAQSEKCSRLFVAPGNPGIEECARVVPIAVDDLDGLMAFAVENDIDLAIIGPEIPLVMGLANRLRGKGVRVFGPSMDAAQLEGSKGFMKDFCAQRDQHSRLWPL
jgi:phosphoribosylamine---glycine ligase